MKLNFTKLQAELAAQRENAVTPKPKKSLNKEEVNRRLVSSLRGEYNEIHNDLEREHHFFFSDNCYRGLMRHHSCNGDSFHFQESSVTGRLEFANQSGLFCNLDDSCR